MNNIDVTKCEFYNDLECNLYTHTYWESEDTTRDLCKEHQDCLYRRFHALKQENEDLNKLTEELGKIIQCKTGTISTLAQTRDRLKEEVKELNRKLLHETNTEMISEDINNEVLKENKELKEKIKDLQVRKDKYYLQNLQYEKYFSDIIEIFEEIKCIIETASVYSDLKETEAYLRIVELFNEVFKWEG